MSLEVRSDEEIIISNEQFWENPPCDRHPAICVDVVPTGEEESEFTDKKTGVTTKKMQPKVWLVFQVFPQDGSRDSEGRPFHIDNKFTASLAPQAILRLKLERWRGQMVNGKLADRPFTNEELKGFNLAKLKGVACWLTILPDNSGRFVNVSDIEPYVDDSGKPLPAPKAEPQHYQRRTYKKKEKAQTVTTQSTVPTSSGSNGNNANDKSAWIPF
jgi:hypothetical protein